MHRWKWLAITKRQSPPKLYTHFNAKKNVYTFNRCRNVVYWHFFSKMDRCSEVLLQIRATIVVELKQHVATKVRLCAGPTIQACKAEAAKETQTDDNRWGGSSWLRPRKKSIVWERLIGLKGIEMVRPVHTWMEEACPCLYSTGSSGGETNLMKRAVSQSLKGY